MPSQRERIFEAALRLIDEHGLDAFNMRDLARELDVAPAAVLWYVEARGPHLRRRCARALRHRGCGRRHVATALRRVLHQFLTC